MMNKTGKTQHIEDELIPIRDVIKMTNLSRPTIYRLRRRGEFPKPVTVSCINLLFWRKSDLIEWQDSLLTKNY